MPETVRALPPQPHPAPWRPRRASKPPVARLLLSAFCAATCGLAACQSSLVYSAARGSAARHMNCPSEDIDISAEPSKGNSWTILAKGCGCECRMACSITSKWETRRLYDSRRTTWDVEVTSARCSRDGCAPCYHWNLSDWPRTGERPPCQPSPYLRDYRLRSEQLLACVMALGAQYLEHRHQGRKADWRWRDLLDREIPRLAWGSMDRCRAGPPLRHRGGPLLLGRLQDLWEGRLVPARCRGRALACRRGRPCSLPDRGPARASWGEAIPEGPIRLLREGPERLRDGRKANELHFGRGLGVLSLCRAEPDKEDSVNFARFWPSRRACQDVLVPHAPEQVRPTLRVPSGEDCCAAASRTQDGGLAPGNPGRRGRQG